MFYLAEIRKVTEGLSFEQPLNVEQMLQERHAEILAVSPVHVTGRVRYDSGLYLLDYTMSYQLTLPSSRSLVPVVLDQNQVISEVFIAEDQVTSQEALIEEDLVLIIEGDAIDLEESVVDNILLHLPLRVLSPEEEVAEELPSGQNWSLLTESQYQAKQAEDKMAGNPFAQLNGLFEEE